MLGAIALAADMVTKAPWTGPGGAAPESPKGRGCLRGVERATFSCPSCLSELGSRYCPGMPSVFCWLMPDYVARCALPVSAMHSSVMHPITPRLPITVVPPLCFVRPPSPPNPAPLLSR